MNRNKAADLLKGIAVIGMIQVHLTELFALPSFYSSIVGSISLFLGGPPAAPVFLAVMGYFLAFSKKSLKQNIIRGISLFFGGILLNIGFNFHLLFTIAMGESTLNPLQYIFGVDILLSAGITIVVIGFTKRFFARNFIIPILCAFLIAGLSSVLQTVPTVPSSFPYVRALFYGSEPWSYFPVIPWLAYPFLGFAAGMLPVQLREKLTSRRVQLFVLAAWIVFLIFFLPFGIEIAALLPQYYHHGTLYFAWVVLFLAGYVLLVLFLERVVPANDVFTYLQWLGRNVTVAYVAQWLIIGNLATILYRSQHPLRVALWFIAIMSAVSALIYSWNFLVAKFSISEGRKNL